MIVSVLMLLSLNILGIELLCRTLVGRIGDRKTNRKHDTDACLDPIIKTSDITLVTSEWAMYKLAGDKKRHVYLLLL